MTENAARAILAAPDGSTAKGRRDQVMLIVLYDTDARISELLELHLPDLRLSTTTPTATLLGKGGVIRTVPLAKETVSMLYKYLAEFHPDEPLTSCAPLFFTSPKNGRQKMCAQTVREWMGKYRETARLKCLEVPERIHPHMWRHTRAMHLTSAAAGQSSFWYRIFSRTPANAASSRGQGYFAGIKSPVEVTIRHVRNPASSLPSASAKVIPITTPAPYCAI